MISTILINSTILPCSSQVLMVEALTHFGKLFMTLSSETCLTTDIHTIHAVMPYLKVF